MRPRPTARPAARHLPGCVPSGSTGSCPGPSARRSRSHSVCCPRGPSRSSSAWQPPLPAGRKGPADRRPPVGIAPRPPSSGGKTEKKPPCPRDGLRVHALACLEQLCSGGAVLSRSQAAKQHRLQTPLLLWLTSRARYLQGDGLCCGLLGCRPLAPRAPRSGSSSCHSPACCR